MFSTPRNIADSKIHRHCTSVLNIPDAACDHRERLRALEMTARSREIRSTAANHRQRHARSRQANGSAVVSSVPGNAGREAERGANFAAE